MPRNRDSVIWLLPLVLVLTSTVIYGKDRNIAISNNDLTFLLNPVKTGSDTITPSKKNLDSVPSPKKTINPADSSIKGKKEVSKSDTAKAKKKRSESGKAALRSAIIPGWGQAYNKKYWKVPIVYGALAIPVATFIYNKNWYEKTRYAYQVKYHNDTVTVTPPLPTDNIDPRLQPLSTQSLQIYRNQFRQGMDFSVLAFLAVWGLQIADAAVDGHLKSFNINDDLSLKVRPYYSPTVKTTGLSMVFTLRDNKPRMALPSY